MNSEPSSPVPPAEALAQWEAERVTGGVAPVNARKQRKRLSTLFESRAWTDVRAVDRGGVVAALADLRLTASAKTANTLLSQLTAFYRWAVRAGLAAVNPCDSIERPRRARRGGGPTRRRGMRPLSNEEVRRWIAAAEADERAPKPRFSCHRSTRIALAWETGGRRSQINGLRWGDLELDAACPMVCYDRDAAKNHDGWRIPLPRFTLRKLMEWRAKNPTAGPEDLVFPVKPRYKDAIVNADLAAAGIPKRLGRGANMHSLRKTLARNLMRSGVPVSTARHILQHHTVQMTLDIYAELEEEDRADAARKLDGLTGEGPSSDPPPDPKPPTVKKPVDKSGDGADTLHVTEDVACGSPVQSALTWKPGRPASALGDTLEPVHSRPGFQASPNRLDGATPTLPCLDMPAEVSRPPREVGPSPPLRFGGSNPPTPIEMGDHLTLAERQAIALLLRDVAARLLMEPCDGPHQPPPRPDP